MTTNILTMSCYDPICATVLKHTKTCYKTLSSTMISISHYDCHDILWTTMIQNFVTCFTLIQNDYFSSNLVPKTPFWGKVSPETSNYFVFSQICYLEVFKDASYKSLTKYLRQTLVFAWNSALREKFNFFFWGDSYKCWQSFHCRRRTEH